MLYKGAAQAMTDLLAGQMHMTIEAQPPFSPTFNRAR
jgi:hypothetical protein